MNSVKRTRGVKRLLQRYVLSRPAQKYVVAGDRACREKIRSTGPRRPSGPSDQAILAWAAIDLAREIAAGFWELRAA